MTLDGSAQRQRFFDRLPVAIVHLTLLTMQRNARRHLCVACGGGSDISHWFATTRCQLFCMGALAGTVTAEVASLTGLRAGTPVAADYAKDKTAAHRALEMIDTVRTDIAARYPDTFSFATSAAEIEAAHRQGKIAALIGIEGGHAIEDDPRLLRDFYALGVRYMTLTHTNTNNWADSSGDLRDRAV